MCRLQDVMHLLSLTHAVWPRSGYDRNLQHHSIYSCIDGVFEKHYETWGGGGVSTDRGEPT